jgi:hypothetical protein
MISAQVPIHEQLALFAQSIHLYPFDHLILLRIIVGSQEQAARASTALIKNI